MTHKPDSPDGFAKPAGAVFLPGRRLRWAKFWDIIDKVRGGGYLPPQRAKAKGKGWGHLQPVNTFFARHRFALAAVLTAVLCAVILAWAGFDLASRVDGQPVYRIVNDTYTQTVELPAGDASAALAQTLPLQGGGTLYGVRLNLTTYAHAFATGQLHVRLTDEEGNTLAEATADCLGLLDNTFTALIFDRPYTPAADMTARLLLWYAGTAGGDAGYPLGLWASEGVASPVQDSGLAGAMPLTDASGASLDASAAVQYVVDYSGTWSRRLSLILGVLVFAAVAGGFVLLGRRAPLWGTVLLCGAVLGTAFAIVTPPLVGPDEYTHLAAAYASASGLLGQPLTTGESDGWRLLVRACDAPYFAVQSGDIGIFAYKTWLSGLSVTGCDGAATVLSEATVGSAVNGMLYVGQTLGIALARALGLGFHAMLLAGRLGNLAVFLLLTTLGVALAPADRKGLLACVALIPQPLQLAGSLSADATVLGLTFCFTALCLALRQRPACRAELALLLVLALAIGPAKAIYLPLAALVCWVPAAHLDWRRAPAAPALRFKTLAVRPGTLVKVLALVLAVLGWVNLNLGAVLYATRDVDNVGLTRGAVAVAIAAAVLGFVYWKIHRSPRWKKIFFGVLAAGVCVAVPVMFWRLTHMWGGLTPEQLVDSIQPNGDSIYTYSAGYICRNLPATLKLLLRSVSAEGAAWLQGLLGTALGEPIVYPIAVSWLIGVGLVLALLASALPCAERTAGALNTRARLGGGVIVALVVGLTFFAALSWTPINYTTIFGVQGRYWLPVLPLALSVLFGGGTFVLRRPAAQGAIFAALCLTSFTLVQGAGLYAAWRMT